MSPVAIAVFAQERAEAGLPAMKCSKIIQFKENEYAVRAITDWTEGFATGFNLGFSSYQSFQYDLGHPSFSSDAIHPRILAVCYEKPDEFLAGVALELVVNLPTFSQDKAGGTK
ncbi:MAG TPA: hypothetical protein VIN05_14825 [Roseovarius sp.]